jgi:hypothetical protein
VSRRCLPLLHQVPRDLRAPRDQEVKAAKGKGKEKEVPKVPKEVVMMEARKNAVNTKKCATNPSDC